MEPSAVQSTLHSKHLNILFNKMVYVHLTKESIDLYFGTDVRDFHSYFEDILETKRINPTEIRYRHTVNGKTFIWYRGYDRNTSQEQATISYPTDCQRNRVVNLFDRILERRERGLEGTRHLVFEYTELPLSFKFNDADIYKGFHRSFKGMKLDAKKIIKGREVLLAHVEYVEGILYPVKNVFDIDGTHLVQPSIAALCDYFRQQEDNIPEDVEEKLKEVQKIRKED